MTSAVHERGVEASPKFRVLLTASLVSSLIMFGSNIVAVSLPSMGGRSKRPSLTSSG
jgi:hypothetical protein